MTAAIVALTFLAALGFALSVCAHIASIFGIAIPGGGSVWLLHVGIFVVWTPCVFLMRRYTSGQGRREMWNRLLGVYPSWIKCLAVGLAAYVFISFLYFTSTMQSQHRAQLASTPMQIRLFSGHWMVFYGAAFLTLLAAIKDPQSVAGRKCPNGHEVGAEQFCPVCGEAVQYRAS